MNLAAVRKQMSEVSHEGLIHEMGLEVLQKGQGHEWGSGEPEMGDKSVNWSSRLIDKSCGSMGGKSVNNFLFSP